jgi:magnesium-transporting ATPase (P-type)
VRDGNNQVIVTAEIVPGDLVELKTGDTIPADTRLIEAVNFETNEALLTGESLPVRKETASIFPDDTGPGDRLNVAYSSSTVTKGRARGIVFATGIYTEIGQIAVALRGKSSRRREPKRREDGTASTGRWMQAWTLTFLMLLAVSSASTLEPPSSANCPSWPFFFWELLLPVPLLSSVPTSSTLSGRSSSTL